MSATKKLGSKPQQSINRLTVALLAFAGVCGSVHGEELMLKFPKVTDPYFGEALYHYNQKDFFQALSHGLVATEADRIPNDDDSLKELMRELYLGFGLHDSAEELLRKSAPRKQTAEDRNHAWLTLANANYARGLYKEAEDALSQIDKKLSGEHSEEKDALLGSLMLAKGDYKKAASIFDDLKGNSDWGTYARYNYAIALLNDGQFDKAVDEMNKVGRRNFASEEMRSLKDRANVALGFLFLRAKDPNKAREYLERVRLNGPFANKALLGIGWAEMMVADYESALVPLMELHGRSIADQAVLEAYLAVPHAFSQVQSPNQSVEYYDKAIRTFENELNNLNNINDKIAKKNALASYLEGDPRHDREWLSRVEGWPDSTESRIFTRLIADRWFNATLTNYQDLRAMSKRVSDWAVILDVYEQMLVAQRGKEKQKTSTAAAPQSVIDLVNARSTTYQHLKLKSKRGADENLSTVKDLKRRAAGLRPELLQALGEHERYLRALVLSEIEMETKRINQYLSQSRFALAQIYENMLRQGIVQ